MKEIIVIIRPGMAGGAKKALESGGLSGFTGRKVLGRGKAAVNITQSDLTVVKSDRVPKRMFIIAVKDEDADKVIQAVTLVNSTGMPGDGRIFVLPITDTYRISAGQKL